MIDFVLIILTKKGTLSILKTDYFTKTFVTFFADNFFFNKIFIYSKYQKKKMDFSKVKKTNICHRKVC